MLQWRRDVITAYLNPIFWFVYHCQTLLLQVTLVITETPIRKGLPQYQSHLEPGLDLIPRGGLTYQDCTKKGFGLCASIRRTIVPCHMPDDV